jgi:hypothetical protein
MNRPARASLPGVGRVIPKVFTNMRTKKLSTSI